MKHRKYRGSISLRIIGRQCLFGTVLQIIAANIISIVRMFVSKYENMGRIKKERGMDRIYTEVKKSLILSAKSTMIVYAGENSDKTASMLLIE